MNRGEMHISLPPSQPISIGSSSTITTTTPVSIPSPLRNSCTTHNTDDAERPGTPYPTNCQLCLSAPSTSGDGHLGAVVEEEEEEEVSMIRGPSTEGVVTESHEGEGERENVPRGEDETNAARLASDSEPPSKSTRVKGKAKEWFKSLVASAEPDAPDSSGASGGNGLSKASPEPARPWQPSPPFAPEHRATSRTPPPPASPRQAITHRPLTPPIVSAGAASPRAPLADRRANFALISLMPVVGYDYTMENSTWKAPPVIGPRARRKKEKAERIAGSNSPPQKEAVLDAAEQSVWSEIKVALHIGR